MSARKAGKRQAQSNLTAAIDTQRQRLFQAAAIVEVCRYACASKFEGFDPEQLFDALRTAHVLIGEAVDALATAQQPRAPDHLQLRRR